MISYLAIYVAGYVVSYFLGKASWIKDHEGFLVPWSIATRRGFLMISLLSWLSVLIFFIFLFGSSEDGDDTPAKW